MRQQPEKHHVCPWWLCFTFDNPLRKFLHDPEQILGPYVRPGDVVLDIGCGMGYFAVPLARLVGEGGEVFAVDIQPKMLSVLASRARRSGVSARVRARLTDPGAIGVDRQVDFALAFWVVHEVPDQRSLLAQVRNILTPGGRLLLAEPILHVSREDFQRTLETAADLGFIPEPGPKIRLSHSALLRFEQAVERGDRLCA